MKGECSWKAGDPRAHDDNILLSWRSLSFDVCYSDGFNSGWRLKPRLGLWERRWPMSVQVQKIGRDRSHWCSGMTRENERFINYQRRKKTSGGAEVVRQLSCYFWSDFLPGKSSKASWALGRMFVSQASFRMGQIFGSSQAIPFHGPNAIQWRCSRNFHGPGP